LFTRIHPGHVLEISLILFSKVNKNTYLVKGHDSESESKALSPPEVDSEEDEDMFECDHVPRYLRPLSDDSTHMWRFTSRTSNMVTLSSHAKKSHVYEDVMTGTACRHCGKRPTDRISCKKQRISCKCVDDSAIVEHARCMSLANITCDNLRLKIYRERKSIVYDFFTRHLNERFFWEYYKLVPEMFNS